jgi:hypothetical protein
MSKFEVNLTKERKRCYLFDRFLDSQVKKNTMFACVKKKIFRRETIQTVFVINNLTLLAQTFFKA